MIIGSDVPLPLGRVVRDGFTTDVDHGDHPSAEQPFLVLREATIDEWAAEIRAQGRTPELSHARSLLAQGKAWFYKVHMD